MKHQMNRSATAGKLGDPDGFRRTPVRAPLPRRGTDAGRRRGQSAVSSLYRETVAGAVVEAVQKGRRHARLPNRAAAFPMLAEAPRRITEILTHRRPSPSDVATAQRHQRRWMAWGRGADDPATPPLENQVWDGEYDACGSANYIETQSQQK